MGHQGLLCVLGVYFLGFTNLNIFLDQQMNLHVYVVILFPNEYPGIYQNRLGYSFLGELIYYEVTIQLKKGKNNEQQKYIALLVFCKIKKYHE